MMFHMLVKSLEIARIFFNGMLERIYIRGHCRGKSVPQRHMEVHSYIYITVTTVTTTVKHCCCCLVRHCAITWRHKSYGVHLDSSASTDSSGLFFFFFFSQSPSRNDFIHWGDGASPSRDGLCSDRFPLLLNYRSQIDDGAADASKMFAWCCNTLWSLCLLWGIASW